MPANLKCPTCGHLCAPPANKADREVRCPACLTFFPARPAVPSLLSRPAPAAAAPPAPGAPLNRTVLAQPEPMVRYTCPRCKKSLESPASFAGQKLNCPDCNQRLQIPQPSLPPPAPPVNKTILAVEEPLPPAAGTPVPSLVPPLAIPVSRGKIAEEPADVLEVEDAQPAQREYCLECGVNVTGRPRLQTCPDCGSVFCSALCYREHREHAHPRRRKKRPRYVECHHCGSTEPPHTNTVVTPAGWALFVILLIFFFPLFWLGLLMTETEMTCVDCGARLD